MKNSELEHIPPQAIEVEAAVLGALMLEAEAFTAVESILQPNSFYQDKHKIIFETILRLKADKKPVDLLTVTLAIKESGRLDTLTPGYITGLTRNVASAANIEHHARIIAEMYVKREMIRKATEIIDQAYSGEDVETISQTWKQAGERLDNIFTIADSGKHISEVLKDTVRDIEADCTATAAGQPPGIITGFKSLDYTTGGWRPGNMIVLAARPGVGKTSFALHFALEAAKAGSWVNIFSLEMNKEDLARILLSSESEVYRSGIRDGELDISDWQKINLAVSRLENLPIIFRDAAGMTVQQIRTAIHQNRKQGCCDFVMVDYLQLVRSQSSKANRELEVSEISRTLKTIALSENIPILALSQLNRDAEGKTPTLANLRESGAIEQDADLVIFLSPDGEAIRTTIAKHRRGKLGDFNVYHDGQMTRFSESPMNFNMPHPDNSISSKISDSPF
ncbi:replicative DNA helicase [Maribellus sp. YY47]|uniref:replicative DNA helicase n=1 Tax=Maribellus sp. YY47 TaxID=2929486 RepID=UPI0020011BA9|nr:replicative DNA helicase [Maribellus sp. YY47]MCK3686164.1 replicative DNA helicase [Maribellus sp. YY47]